MKTRSKQEPLPADHSNGSSPFIQVNPNNKSTFTIRGVFKLTPRSTKKLSEVGILNQPQLRHLVDHEEEEEETKGRRSSLGQIFIMGAGIFIILIALIWLHHLMDGPDIKIGIN